MRTKHKSPAYFDQFLAVLEQRADQRKAAHAVALAGREAVVPAFEHELVVNLLAQLRVRYSRGDARAEIAGRYPEIAARFIKSWEPGNVVYAVLFDVLALGVLLDAPAETFARIGQLVDQARLRDYLIDYFLAWRQPRPLHPGLRWPADRACNGLRQLAQAPDAPARLREYLDQDWYRPSNTDIRYQSHLRDEYLFSGYWSFGAGAVAKIRGLDDTALALSETYPYDLVHGGAPGVGAPAPLPWQPTASGPPPAPTKETQAIGAFLALLLPELAPALTAELAQACAADFNADPWPTTWELLQDHGYAWPLPWHTAPTDVAYGLRVLWARYGLPALPFPDPTDDGKTTAEKVVRAFGALAQTRQLTLAHLYEDSDFAVLALVPTATLAAARRAAEAAGGTLGTF